MSVLNIKTIEQFNSLINANKPTVVLFFAEWAEQCKQVRDVLEDLSKVMSEQLQFVTLVAETFPEISIKHQIEAVPTIIFFNKGCSVDRVDGVDVAAVTTKCKRFTANVDTDSCETLENRLQALINKAPVMIFMKGDRNVPRCGFSKQLISIINETGISYETFDILTDEKVRQGLKTYSDWPTYPQVYVKGELIGGLDIIKELLASNELESTLKG